MAGRIRFSAERLVTPGHGPAQQSRRLQPPLSKTATRRTSAFRPARVLTPGPCAVGCGAEQRAQGKAVSPRVPPAKWQEPIKSTSSIPLQWRPTKGTGYSLATPVQCAPHSRNPVLDGWHEARIHRKATRSFDSDSFDSVCPLAGWRERLGRDGKLTFAPKVPQA